MCQKIKFSIIVLCLSQAICLAAETEVQVLKGKVHAVTPDQQLDISVGQKGILVEGQKPLVMVTDPLVQQVIEMYRWAQEEMQAGLNPIKSVNISVQRIDEEKNWGYAALMEWTNQSSEKLNEVTLGPVTTMDNLQIYDMQGHVLTYEAKTVGSRSSSYTISLYRPIEPNQKICFVISSRNYNRAYWQSKGPVWNINFGWGGDRPLLQYVKVILPKSAILVSCYPAFSIIDRVEDRIALTFRYYGSDSILSLQQVSFLWPDKGGTTLQDVPARARGLIDPKEVRLAQDFQSGITSILAGGSITDTSTPMDSLLTLISLLANDVDKLDTLSRIPPFLKSMFGDDLEKAKTELKRHKDYIYISDYYSDGVIPKDAKEGTVVAITLKLKGTIVPYAKVEFVFKEGQWLPCGFYQV